MALNRLSLNPVSTNPCDQQSMQRILAGLNNNVGNLVQTINELVDIVNILNVTNIEENTFVQTIVNNNTFVTNVNEYISNYISNYYTSVYAQSILFTLSAPLALSGGVWQAAATVNTIFSGENPPGGVVTVKDPAGIWRWKSLTGAKGVAVRGSVDGSVYVIMDIETIPDAIRGYVYADFTTADQSFETAAVNQKYDGSLSAMAAVTGNLKIGNPPDGMGAYMFQGNTGYTFMAKLVDKDTKPANTAGDPLYECWQVKC